MLKKNKHCTIIFRVGNSSLNLDAIMLEMNFLLFVVILMDSFVIHHMLKISWKLCILKFNLSFEEIACF